MEVYCYTIFICYYHLWQWSLFVYFTFTMFYHNLLFINQSFRDHLCFIQFGQYNNICNTWYQSRKSSIDKVIQIKTVYCVQLFITILPLDYMSRVQSSHFVLGVVLGLAHGVPLVKMTLQQNSRQYGQLSRFSTQQWIKLMVHSRGGHNP